MPCNCSCENENTPLIQQIFKISDHFIAYDVYVEKQEGPEGPGTLT